MGTFGYFAVKAQMSGAVNVSDFLEQDDEAGAIIALVPKIATQIRRMMIWMPVFAESGRLKISCTRAVSSGMPVSIEITGVKTALQIEMTSTA